MAFLVIAGVTMEMTTFRRRPPVLTGAFTRAFSGAGRSSVRPASKAEWEGTTRPMTTAEITTLVTAMGGRAAVVAVSGDGVDAASDFNAYVTVSGEDYLPVNETSHQRSLSITVQTL